MAANTPFCPTCGAPAVWQAHAKGWGCDRCRQMLPVAQPVAQVALPPGQKPMVCPRCSLPATFHPESQRWGCDRCRAFLDTMWPFNTQGKPANRHAQGVKMIFGGIGLILLGAVITGATHEAAVSNGGGTYFIAYGPIVVGVMLLFRGLYGLVV